MLTEDSLDQFRYFWLTNIISVHNIYVHVSVCAPYSATGKFTKRIRFHKFIHIISSLYSSLVLTRGWNLNAKNSKVIFTIKETNLPSLMLELSDYEKYSKNAVVFSNLENFVLIYSGGVHNSNMLSSLSWDKRSDHRWVWPHNFAWSNDFLTPSLCQVVQFEFEQFDFILQIVWRAKFWTKCAVKRRRRFRHHQVDFVKAQAIDNEL